ncbi:MAG: hypothetical protein M3Q56_04430 [Bacteroidota bacterium]|nr:hypothetical protein [Bacteroidota bacterium]
MPLLLEAQERTVMPETVRKGLIYKKEKSIDLVIHTNGFYVGYNLGKIKSYYKTHFLHFDLGLLEHPRESKSSSSFSNGPQSFTAYTYGKQNSLWNMRIGRGLTRYFSEKARQKGLAIGMIVEGGITLGLLKPYYLKYLSNHDGKLKQEQIKYSAETADEFLDDQHIEGAGSFFKGITELKLAPGAHGKIALHLDPGAFEKYVKAVDIGFMIDLYTKRVPIMVSEKNPYFFLNFYVNLQLGSRK